MGTNYSPGRLDGIPPAVATTIRELWDRMNWLLSLAQDQQAAGGAASIASNQGTMSAVNDPLMTGTTFAGSTIGGTEDVGIASISMAADADQTVPPTLAAKRILEVSGGATLTATRNLNLPNVSGKMWIVANLTNGGQSLTFKTQAGSGVTVGNNRRAIVYCNGAGNVVRVTADA